MRKIIYEDYIRIATEDILSEDAQIILALMNLSKINLAWKCASKIIDKVVDDSGNITRNLTPLEKNILLMNPACLINNDGSIQYDGHIFK